MEPIGIIVSIGLWMLGHLLASPSECNHMNQIKPVKSPVAVISSAPVDNSNAKRKAELILDDLKSEVI